MKKNIFIAILISTAFLGLTVFSGLGNYSNENLDEYSKDLIEKCSQVKNLGKQRCYDTELPKLVGKISMEKTFEVIKLIQSKDPDYWFCHAGAHNISRAEYLKHPANWREIMNRCPPGICSNGCLHGALQEHFSSETLNGAQINETLPDLANICEERTSWKPTPLEQASCYHEAGHLSLYLTGGNPKLAGSICDSIAVKADGRNFTQTCTEGIFMQIFEPREPDDFSLIYNLIPHKDNLLECNKFTTGVEKGSCWKKGWTGGEEKNFCSSFAEQLKNSCFGEAWIINDDGLKNASGIISYCSYTDSEIEQNKCYNKIFYSLMSEFEFDLKKVMPICNEFSSIEIKSLCYSSVATRMVETDQNLSSEALKVCESAKSEGLGLRCFTDLANYASFALPKSSENFSKLCNGMPKDLVSKCFGDSKQI